MNLEIHRSFLKGHGEDKAFPNKIGSYFCMQVYLGLNGWFSRRKKSRLHQGVLSSLNYMEEMKHFQISLEADFFSATLFVFKLMIIKKENNPDSIKESGKSS